MAREKNQNKIVKQNPRENKIKSRGEHLLENLVWMMNPSMEMVGRATAGGLW
jgi:hypothetical protein